MFATDSVKYLRMLKGSKLLMEAALKHIQHKQRILRTLTTIQRHKLYLYNQELPSRRSIVQLSQHSVTRHVKTSLKK